MVSIHGMVPETLLSFLLEGLCFGFSSPWGGRGLSAAHTDLGDTQSLCPLPASQCQPTEGHN